MRGAWLGLKYVVSEMENRGGGNIVITSAIVGVGSHANISAYVASKHAVIGFMRSAAAESAHLGIRVNTINPGPTETRMVESLEAQESPTEPDRVKQDILQNIGLGHYASAKEIAKTMLYLASDDSSYCTGGVFMVNSGVSKRR